MWWTEKSIKTEQEKLKAQSKRKKIRENYILLLHTANKNINQQIVNVNCTYIKGRCVRRMMLFSKANDRPEWLGEAYFGAPKPDREREREEREIDKRTRTTKAVSERV